VVREVGSSVESNGLFVTIVEVMLLLIHYKTRTDALSKTVKNEGQKPRWSQQDAYILVHK